MRIENRNSINPRSETWEAKGKESEWSCQFKVKLTGGERVHAPPWPVTQIPAAGYFFDSSSTPPGPIGDTNETDEITTINRSQTQKTQNYCLTKSIPNGQIPLRETVKVK